MRGMPGIRHQPGMRHLPRPGSTGGSCGCLSVPGLRERRSRCGTGPGGTFARDRSGRDVGTSVACSMTLRTLPGRVSPACRCAAPRPAALTFPAPPQRRDTRRSAALHCGCRKAPLASSRRRHSPRPVQGRDARRRRPAATPGGHGAKASSLPSSLRGEVVTTLYVVGFTTRKPACFVGFPCPARKNRKVPESAGGRRRSFPSHSAKQIDPDVRPCMQGEIGCPTSGARGHFAMRD